MNLNLAIVVAFTIFIFISNSCHFSFAKTNNEKEEDDKKYSKETFDISININQTRNDDLKKSYIQNDNTNTLNNNYPDGYYVCGYPKQLITDYSFLEKLDCD